MKSCLAMAGIAAAGAISVYSSAAFAAGVDFNIVGSHAQAIYQSMTGVQEEGAAGHTEKNGKNIHCVRINADMDDAQGKPVPADAPGRYKCTFHIDASGQITPGT